MPTVLPSRPLDATLSVTKAARLLGVHANTVRAWSDAGRLRYYRINPRGDRRYRLGDLQRFLAAAESGLPERARSGTSRAPRPPRLELLPPSAAAARDRDARRSPLPPAAPARRRSTPTAGRRSQPARRADPDRRRRLRPSPSPCPRRPPRSATAARTGPSRCSSSAATGSTRRQLRPRLDAARRAAARLRRDRRRARPGECRHGRRPGELGIVDEPADPTPASTVTSATSVGHRRPARDRRGDPRRRRAVGRARRRRRPRRRSSRRSTRRSSATSPPASRRSSSRPASRRTSATSSTGPTRCAAWPATSAAGSTSTGSSSGLVEHAMVLFEADRGAVFLRHANGRPSPRSAAACRRPTSRRVKEFPVRSLPSLAVAARRPLFAGGYSDDPRGEDVRAAVVQEGYDTICTAPLFDGPDAPRPAQRLPRRAARLERRRARHDGGARDAGVGRDQERPELRADGDLGRPAPVDPAARRPAHRA